MAAYCRVYDSRYLQADCSSRDHLRNPTLSNRVWATFLPDPGQPTIVGLTKYIFCSLVPPAAIRRINGCVSVCQHSGDEFVWWEVLLSENKQPPSVQLQRSDGRSLRVQS